MVKKISNRKINSILIKKNLFHLQINHLINLFPGLFPLLFCVPDFSLDVFGVEKYRMDPYHLKQKNYLHIDLRMQFHFWYGSDIKKGASVL